MAGKNSVFVDNSAPSVDATYLNLYKTESNNIITTSGQSLSDAIDDQEVIGISRYAANNFYIDSGAANAYVLTLAASMTNPVSATVGYFIGMTIRFRAGNANTGASTVNVGGAGVKNIKLSDGTTDLAAGDIPTTQDTTARYDGTNFIIYRFKAPTVQKFTSGSGTYTTPADTLYIRVKMVGGGGGGSGSGTTTSGGSGGTAGNTTFGTALLTCNGGVGATASGGGGAGGSATLNSPGIGTAFQGGAGSSAGSQSSTDAVYGASGASSFFGGAGGNNVTTGVGTAAIANTGAGGGGGGMGTTTNARNGFGGGAGGFIDAIISLPSATYSYAIGAAGAAGTAGTSGNAGGAGGSGYIEVTEYYQ